MPLELEHVWSSLSDRLQLAQRRVILGQLIQSGAESLAGGRNQIGMLGQTVGQSGQQDVCNVFFVCYGCRLQLYVRYANQVFIEANKQRGGGDSPKIRF